MIKLYHGDCLGVMWALADSGITVDAVITDPPYGTTACKWDSVIDFDKMWSRLNNLIKPNGAIVLFGSEPFSSALRMSNIHKYRYDWVWIKTKASNFQHARKMPMKRHETISIFYSTLPTYNLDLCKLEIPVKSSRTNKGANLHGERIKDSGDYYQKETGFKFSDICFPNPSGKGHLHPTQKPVDLMEYLIKTYTNEGETVLDFTMGSGTTGVACKNLNRKFIGIEQDEKYFKIARDRINEPVQRGML